MSVCPVRECQSRNLEGGGIWNAYWKVREYGEQLICCYATEREVVGDLMDGKEEVVVCRATDRVGAQKEHGGHRFDVSK